MRHHSRAVLILVAIFILAGPALGWSQTFLESADAVETDQTATLAEVVNDQDQVPPPPPKTGHFKFAQQVWSDVRHLPSLDSLYWLGGGGGLSLALHPADDDVNGRFAKNRGLFRPGKVVGSFYLQAGGALATYIVGRANHHPRVKHLGTDLLSAQLVAQGLTQAIKVTVRRDRPDGTGFSFPSGHASATFASATVLQRHLGWKAAVPTYTVASYVALSRLSENRHFLSDVVFGGAVGIVAGRTTTRHGRSNYGMIPVISPQETGVFFTRSFR